MTSTTPEPATNGSPARTATVNLPFLRAEFRAPDVRLPRMPKPHLPDRNEVTAALHTARSYLPPPRQLAYYGGLGLLAAVELIEWPVAVAIGVGTAVAGRGKGEEPRPQDTGKQTGPPGTSEQAVKAGTAGTPQPATETGAPETDAPAVAKVARARAGTQKKGGGTGARGGA
ncbi:hypothetical protein [Amycolatopsis thermophila]|uniref:Uncharacterized protein n=1 Tax=Amycolatopsis thermophila TaxID=206084 RepID=A0ABU0ELE6_9PSEU|nr:hypothetical protein [Amycolatopsis thermophila]MDQ0376110.1 hypothetical protein [Amycolatopsis thermophila]